MLRATSVTGVPACTRAATVARARGGNRASWWVFMGALRFVRECLDSLSLQPLSPVNNLLFLYSLGAAPPSVVISRLTVDAKRPSWRAVFRIPTFFARPREDIFPWTALNTRSVRCRCRSGMPPAL
jgi:hypothetical protein